MRRVQAVLLVSLAGLMFGVLGLQASPPDEPISQAVKEVFLEGDPPGPIVGHLAGENGRSLAVRDNYVYAGFGDEFVVIDVTDKSMPVENGRLSISQTILDIAVKGNYAYLGTIDGLQIVDISEPDNPQWHSIFEPIPMTRIKIRGDYGYVLSSEGLFILDMANAPQLTTVGHFERGITNPLDLDLIGDYAFVLIGPLESLLLIIDTQNKNQPYLIHSQSEGASQMALTHEFYVDVDNGCSQICQTNFVVYSWDSVSWDFQLQYHYNAYNSASTLAVEADEIYAYIGKDVGLFMYSLSITDVFSQWFEVWDARDIQRVGDYLYVISEDNVDGGLYILPAPPIYYTYMPFVPNN